MNWVLDKMVVTSSSLRAVLCPGLQVKSTMSTLMSVQRIIIPSIILVYFKRDPADGRMKVNKMSEYWQWIFENDNQCRGVF
jgi:hypothetical protein